MRLKRLELRAEYDDGQLDVFHTSLQPNPDPPTIIVADGKEYEGRVTFNKEDNGTYSIRITII